MKKGTTKRKKTVKPAPQKKLSRSGPKADGVRNIRTIDQAVYGKHHRRTRKGGDPAALVTDIGWRVEIDGAGNLITKDRVWGSMAWWWLSLHGGEVAKAILRRDAGFFTAISEMLTAKSTAPTGRLAESGDLNPVDWLRANLIPLRELGVRIKTDPGWGEQFKYDENHPAARLVSQVNGRWKMKATVEQLEDILREPLKELIEQGARFDRKTIKIAAKQCGITLIAKSPGRPRKPVK
ncbi:MAG: hypothetical protein WAL87_08345 [Chthoniobacterales bacterium]